MPSAKFKQNAQLEQALQSQPVHKPQQMVSQPGIARDGTLLQNPTYSDGEWMRFWQGRPRKMLGYREQVRTVDGVARNLNLFSNDGFCYVHMGSTEAFQRYAIDLVTGSNTGVIDRSPAAFTPADNVLWQSDVIYDAVVSATSVIFAAPLPTLTDITSSTAAAVYVGDTLSTSILIPALDAVTSAAITTTGGLVSVGPYLFLYGHDGVISWNVAGSPRNRAGAGSGDARPVADKIVRGMPVRGNTAPAALFWSLSSLIIGNYVTTSPFWRFSTISTNGSILSGNGVVEHNGIYYWAHTSGFSMFSGVMQDIPNDYNQQYFLDNLNFAERQKVFAVKVPRFREIWWCFPKGTSTEPNHAIIYNYEKKFWYDTPLPNGGRGAGYYDVTYAYPIMSGVTENDDTGGTSVWQHETGHDEVSGALATASAIKSFYVTHEFNMPVAAPGEQGENKSLSFAYLEPDFGQTGDLTLEIFSRNNANDPDTQSPDDDSYPYVIEAEPSDSQAQTPDIKWTGRLTRFKVQSNVAGGNYVTGVPLLHLMPGDGRMIG